MSCGVSVGGARLKNWWLVLYGTERNPQQPQTSSTTTTTTPQPTTTVRISRQRKHNPPQHSPYYRFDSEGISSRLHEPPKPPVTRVEKTEKTYDRHKNDNSETRLNSSDSDIQASITYFSSDWGPFDEFHVKNKKHMCLFETLARQNNMSTRQYYQMMKKDLTSGKKLLCDQPVTVTTNHLHRHSRHTHISQHAR